MAGSNISSKSELIEYTQQHPVWASASERLQVCGGWASQAGVQGLDMAGRRVYGCFALHCSSGRCRLAS
jgi:hypothetical protein